MNLGESREGGPLKVRGDSGKLEKESPDFRSPEVGISETITGSRKDPNTTIKGKISVFIVVLKFVMHFCNRRTIAGFQCHAIQNRLK